MFKVVVFSGVDLTFIKQFLAVTSDQRFGKI